MTRQKSFKRLVRARMDKTGESYTAARAMLLAAAEEAPPLATSDERIRERTATRPRSARFDWDGGESRVNVTFAARSGASSLVAVEHARLADAGEAERMKAYWRERLTALKAELEGAATDA